MKKNIFVIATLIIVSSCTSTRALYSNKGYWATVQILLPQEGWCKANYWIPDTLEVSRDDILYFSFKPSTESDEPLCQEMELVTPADTTAEKEGGASIYRGIVEKVRSSRDALK